MAAVAVKDNKLIKIKTDVRVIMVPSHAKSVIINYSRKNTLRVSCTIPAKQRKVSTYINTDPISIVSPPTLFCLEISDIPARVMNEVICNYYVHGYCTEDKKTLWTAPYRLPNVYSDGAVCFGSVYPRDLRAVYNLFWETPFNLELADCSADLVYSLKKGNVISYDDLDHYIKLYKKELFDEQAWIDNTEKFVGKKPWICSKPSHAILLTSNKELLEQIPKEHWLRYKGRPFIAANARRYKNVWSFDTGKFKFKLPIEQVLTKDPKIHYR